MIGIIQDIDYNNDIVTIALLLCDLVFSIDTIMYMILSKPNRNKINKIYSINYSIDNHNNHNNNNNNNLHHNLKQVAQTGSYLLVIIRYINVEMFLRILR